MFSQKAKLLPVIRRFQYTAVERCRKGCTSSLFITGDKASESCAVLKPHIELDDRFEDMKTLIKNVSSREMTIDVHQLKASWQQYQILRDYKLNLDREKSEIQVKLRTVNASNSRMFNNLKDEATKIKEKLRTAKEELWVLENKAVLGGLSLPNEINSETPDNDSEKIVYQFGQQPDMNISSPSHLEVANKLGLIEFYDSSYYFLKDEAAQFEMGISYMFMDNLRDIGFIPISNSDFSRSLVVEGVGLDPKDANSVFTLEMESDSKDPNARLHLVGGASLASFCAYHTKTKTNVKSLPLRYVTIGRHYNPANHQGLHGLFSSWQSSAVETYIVTKDKDMAMQEFKVCLKTMIELYESLGYHFRVEYLPPKSLKPWESLRASIQMFSNNMKTYLEVGSLSLCDDYISKRLLMCYEMGTEKPLGFTHVISGTVLSVPRILGCVLEYDTDKLKLPANVAAAAS